MSNTNNFIFSKNLKHFMEINNKSRYDLVNDLDFKYSTVCEWISGKKIPRMDKIQKLAFYFGISLSDLLEEKNAPAEDDRSKEKEIEKMLRNLSDSELDKVAEFIAFLLSQRKGEK